MDSYSWPAAAIARIDRRVRYSTQSPNLKADRRVVRCNSPSSTPSRQSARCADCSLFDFDFLRYPALGGDGQTPPISVQEESVYFTLMFHPLIEPYENSHC